MAAVIRILGRNCLLRQTSALLARRSTMSTKPITAYEEMSKFWMKNKQLARPLSPHLSIYGYHLTMVMSITNRVMCTAMQVVITGGSIMLMVLPTDYTSILKKIKKLNIGDTIIYSFKFLLAVPMVYHALCSLRHMIWDCGYGYKGTHIIQSGYVIMAATALLSSALVFGFKPSML